MEVEMKIELMLKHNVIRLLNIVLIVSLVACLVLTHPVSASAEDVDAAPLTNEDVVDSEVPEAVDDQDEQEVATLAASGFTSISLGNTTSFETKAVGPDAVVTYQLNGEGLSNSNTVIVERNVDGLWIAYNTNIGKVPNSGQINLFYGTLIDKKEAIRSGTYTFRLALADDSGVVSPDITVKVNKAETTFDIGSKTIVASFYQSGPKSHIFTNTLYYDLYKTVYFKYPQYDVKTYGTIYLQRFDGKKWASVEDALTYGNASYDWVDSTDFSIHQFTPAKTQYRLYIPSDDYVTGGTSEVFTISGKKQNPTVSVKYSKSSQKYKKTQVKLTMSVGKAYRGKLKIYDGKKLLKTIKAKGTEKVTYKLSKNLKKGTHKITVKYTPNEEYTGFYNSKTTAVKKIKVKK
jgi:small nuclear ribonucleoprotein (snRNP)-like protein